MPEPWQHLYEQAVEWVVRWGYTVATGAAKGADQVAASQAVLYGGQVELYLPATDFEQEWVRSVLTMPGKRGKQVHVVVYDPAKHEHWAESVSKFHPNPSALTPYSWKLMARNYGIVEGAKAVIAIPKRRKLADGQESLGGTGQGIRIARALGIPVFDLSTPEGREALQEKMARHPARKAAV